MTPTHNLSRRLQTHWLKSPGLIAYREAVAFMEARVAAIAQSGAAELIWLVEHPPLYTAGTSARAEDLRTPGRFPVFETGRGGQLTYHGPGQRVVYVMLDLSRRGRDVRAFVHKLEAWAIATLSHFGVRGEVRQGRVGVWVRRPESGPGGKNDGRPGREDKIAAIGIRLRRWVSYHGLSLNVNPALDHYDGIIPCGLDGATTGFGVTSLADLGHTVSMAQVDAALKHHFEEIFGPVSPAPDRLALSAAQGQKP